MVPKERIRNQNNKSGNPKGDFVLYWMIASRRLTYNFGLERAVEWANKLKKPLVVLEALRCDYPWASDRVHYFVISAMAFHDEKLKDYPVTYYPYLEAKKGQGKGLLKTFSNKACVIVTDYFPCFFLPKMVESTGKKVSVLMETIDSNGLLPLSVCKKDFSAAFHFRRFLQKNLPIHLERFPKGNPLKGVDLPQLKSLPKEILAHWPRAKASVLKNPDPFISTLPIDHKVKALALKGGGQQAHIYLKRFLEQRLNQYHLDRNQPSKEITSNLSPYLHFGHLSSHKIFKFLMKKEGWNLEKISSKCDGRREGWWGCSINAEAFLDQFITWRELGYVFCVHRKDYDHYESLPKWAKETLAEHEKDLRPYLYSLKEFENAKTHDPLWNAAQKQLIEEGKIHNYLRMLWAKKILHWSKTPQEALEIMIELNNKYALDGRNPNSYCGIFWCLGRFDRPWGPERSVFGKVRYMTSDSTAKKFNVRGYLQKFQPTQSLL